MQWVASGQTNSPCRWRRQAKRDAQKRLKLQLISSKHVLPHLHLPGLEDLQRQGWVPVSAPALRKTLDSGRWGRVTSNALGVHQPCELVPHYWILKSVRIELGKSGPCLRWWSLAPHKDNDCFGNAGSLSGQPLYLQIFSVGQCIQEGASPSSSSCSPSSLKQHLSILAQVGLPARHV